MKKQYRDCGTSVKKRAVKGIGLHFINEIAVIFAYAPHILHNLSKNIAIRFHFVSKNIKKALATRCKSL